MVISANMANFFDTGAGGYPSNGPDLSTTPNFTTPGGLAFARTTGFNPGANNVTFTVYNDDNPNKPANPTGNPSGLSFCYSVTFDPAPPQVAVFVIGDVEPHAVGDNVNFSGALWWKNNDMSGTVSNGVAAFKGYASLGGDVCGATWTSLPGNSSNPPATIGSDILVIVTSKVLKAGPNISGDIKKLVMVHQDVGYGPNPGHAGNGAVK